MMDSMPPEQPESASIERDNKLLHFQPPTYPFTLLDISLRRTGISLSAQLHGMFFMAEPQEPGPGTTAPAPASTELTCYRRNLFQITGTITLPRALRYITTEMGDRIPILNQELFISATESVEGHPVKLISVPWKTPINNTSTTPEDKSEKEPVSIPLDTMSNQDLDADFATFPIAWKRLQFRIATANNGRRKELQQHFVVRLRVVATLATGNRVSICEARSGAIIVRGRSPRNFQQRKDLPVGGTGANNRRPVAPTRTPTSDSAHGLKAERKSPETTPSSGSVSMGQQLDNQDLQTPTTFSTWGQKPNPGSSSRMNSLPAPSNYAQPTAYTSRSASTSSLTPPTQPKPLRLHDSPDPHHPRQHKAPRTTSSAIPSTITPTTSAAFLSTNNDAADLLYEYFPLGVNDWKPPVDAVYRPHVVHHILGAQAGTPGGGMGRGLGGMSNRYFSGDQGKGT